jgi:two-component sensor histidine kinase
MRTLLFTLFIVTAPIQMQAGATQDSLITKTLIEKIGTLDEEDDSDSTTFYALKMLSHTQKSEHKAGEAFALAVIGWQFQLKGDFPKASDYTFKSLRIYEEINDTNGIVKCLGFIGVIYDMQGDHLKAIEYNLKAYEMAKDIGDTANMSDQLNNIAIAYAQTHNNEKAEIYYLKGIDLNKKTGNKESLARNYVNLGSLYENDGGQYKRALNSYSKAIAICNELNLTTGLAYCNLSIASVYSKMKNHLKQEEHLIQAMKASKESNNIDLISSINNNLSQLYSTIGKYELALNYYQKHISTRDSIYNKENTRKVLESEMEYEYEKQKIIDDKESEKSLELERAAKDKQELILYLSLIAFLIILAIIIISYKKINAKNKGLEKSLDKNKTLTKELHHRVKNNLQVISSLLNLQSRNINDPKALAAIREGESRVNSIALMHQKLYQTDTISEVDFKQYTEELIDYLKTINAKPNCSIIIKMMLEDIKLDIDTAVPLGLIINELISNSFKHGFKNKQEGIINISITYTNSSQQQICLIVNDNGVGLPPNINMAKIDSLGLKLINMFTKQLEGTIDISNDNGAYFKIIVANTELRKTID